MKTVSIDELHGELSGYLQCVRNGEEIVVNDHNVPVARILPFQHGTQWEREARLVATGVLKMPEQEMDWDDFFSIPGADIAQDIVVAALIEGRGDH